MEGGLLLDLVRTLAAVRKGMVRSHAHGLAGLDSQHGAGRTGMRSLRRKPSADLIGSDDGDAFGRRFSS